MKPLRTCQGCVSNGSHLKCGNYEKMKSSRKKRWGCFKKIDNISNP